ncbi:VanZ family protein [Holzapfeliella sp. He02]|uniref:VanZ family protein n=1 Tax=Holzapfeliella saturejae TaxID=3082953 RepID=A0ABU8SFV5_9LACO
MIFLNPIYQFIVNHFADKINHFPLVELVFYSLDKTIFYFLIFTVLYLGYLKLFKKKQTKRHITLILVLVFYLILLLSLTVFRGIYFPSDIKFYFNRPVNQINLQILDETMKLSFAKSRLDFFYNSFGNILWFMPLGFIAKLLSKKRLSILTITLISILFSMSIEGMQFILWTGVADIDDVIFNTIGGFLGAILGLIFQQIFNNFTKRSD